jgi:hypothetical protein
MRNIEEAGVVREMQYWGLLNDLYIYDISKGRNSRNNSNANSHKTSV